MTRLGRRFQFAPGKGKLVEYVPILIAVDLVLPSMSPRPRVAGIKIYWRLHFRALACATVS
eukprot:6950184-Pyramimonas_sp.AAC.1